MEISTVVAFKAEELTEKVRLLRGAFVGCRLGRFAVGLPLGNERLVDERFAASCEKFGARRTRGSCRPEGAISSEGTRCATFG